MQFFKTSEVRTSVIFMGGAVGMLLYRSLCHFYDQLLVPSWTQWALAVAGLACVCRFSASQGGSAATAIKEAVERGTKKGKVMVVTGANGGVGYQTALQLAKTGATVVLATRTGVKAAEQCAADMRLEVSQKLDLVTDLPALALDDFSSVARFASALHARFPKEDAVDTLINNAAVLIGGYSNPNERSERAGSLERHTKVNALSPMMLTERLLAHSPKMRVVNLADDYGAFLPCDANSVKTFVDDVQKANSGDEEERKQSKLSSAFMRYGASKVLVVHYTLHLRARGVSAVAVHPGGVGTPIQTHVMPQWCYRFIAGPLMRFFFKTPEEGAQTSLHCALIPELDIQNDSLAIYADCHPCSHILYDHAKSTEQRDAAISWMKQQLP